MPHDRHTLAAVVTVPVDGDHRMDPGALAAGAIWLKLTLLNPHATEADVDAVLDAVVAATHPDTSSI